MQSDAELVKAVLSGRKEAFAVLVGRYGRAVRAVAVDVLGDHHRAADVSQDVFVTAYEKLGSLRKADAFGAWVMRIARRRAIDSSRRRPKETRLETSFGVVIEKANGQLDERKAELLAAVVRLPKAERDVVMLRYFSQNSVADVAEILGRGVGTVTKQLSRAHRRLRSILTEMEA